MRAIMARLRGPRASGPVYDFGNPTGPEPIMMPEPDRRSSTPPERRITMTYGDAESEAARVCQRLGLAAPDFADVGDMIRYAYAQGWLACESRLASPDMADLIYQALKDPASVIDTGAGDIQHQIRAVQQIVSYGVKSEPR